MRSETRFVNNNAEQFCLDKGFDDWTWKTLRPFDSDFYCINGSKEKAGIEDYYWGVKNK